MTAYNEVADTVRFVAKAQKLERTRMWANAQRDGRPAEPSAQCRKVWLTPLLERRALTLPIYESARLARKVSFAPGNIPLRGRAPKVYSILAEETAKQRAKFGWPPVSDVAAVAKTRRETR